MQHHVQQFFSIGRHKSPQAMTYKNMSFNSDISGLGFYFHFNFHISFTYTYENHDIAKCISFEPTTFRFIFSLCLRTIWYLYVVWCHANFYLLFPRLLRKEEKVKIYVEKRDFLFNFTQEKFQCIADFKLGMLLIYSIFPVFFINETSTSLCINRRYI